MVAFETVDLKARVRFPPVALSFTKDRTQRSETQGLTSEFAYSILASQLLRCGYSQKDLYIIREEGDLK